MHRNFVRIAAGVFGAVSIGIVVGNCGDSTAPGKKTFIANLSPANEVPPKTTAGTGVATFVDLGSEIDWTLSLTNMTGVIASHIHLGAAGTAPASNIIFNLFIPQTATPTVNGIVGHGSITNANNANVSLDSLRVLFNNGNAYVNVHTTANPPGEIRDQVHPQ